MLLLVLLVLVLVLLLLLVVVIVLAVVMLLSVIEEIRLLVLAHYTSLLSLLRFFKGAQWRPTKSVIVVFVLHSVLPSPRPQAPKRFVS